MTVCPTVSTADAFLSSLLELIDCRGESIGILGYQALSDPNAAISTVLTALITIFIALFGVRMILGHTPTLRDGVMAVVKVGVVLLIATSWPAYRTVIYDVVVRGPVQLAAAIAGPTALVGGEPELIRRLQVADNAVARLTTLGSGRNDLNSVSAAGPDGRVTAAERTPLSDDLAFGMSRVTFVSGLVAAFAIVRLGAGILLAVAPLIAGLLLFNIGRGVFVGWTRALVFIFFASVATTLLVSVELAVLEPWLTQVLQLRNARFVTASAPIELFIITLGFCLTLLGTLMLLLRMSFMIDFQVVGASLPDPISRVSTALTTRSEGSPALTPQSQTRAAGLAAAIATAQGRESATRVQRSVGPSAFTNSNAAQNTASPLSHYGAVARSGSQRRKSGRRSNASALRDRTS